MCEKDEQSVEETKLTKKIRFLAEENFTNSTQMNQEMRGITMAMQEDDISLACVGACVIVGVVLFAAFVAAIILGFIEALAGLI